MTCAVWIWFTQQQKESSVYRSLLHYLAYESALLFVYPYTKVRRYIILEEGRCIDRNSGAGCFLNCNMWHCNSVSDLNARIELVTA